MTRRALALAVVLAVVLAACDPGAREAEPFTGIWESEGWGTFLLVEGGDVEIFEHTEVHCLSVASGGARGVADVLSLDGERLVMRDNDRVVRFDPIELLPPRCADASGSPDPERAIAVLAATVDEQMAPPPDPEWEERLAEASLLAAGADDSVLLEAIGDLLDPLGGAVRVATPDRDVAPPRPRFEPPDGTSPAADGAAATGTMSAGVAYVGFDRIGPFDEDTEESERELTSLVDEAVRSSAVIIDLRAADGGVLGHALLAATRFVPTQTVVGRMEARAGDGFVPAGDLTVTPLPTGVYEGDAFVLVGPRTRGVAEVLALALSTAPTVTLVGAPTAGTPGPPLIRFLPNGWTLSVPNLRVLDGAGAEVGFVEPDVVSDDPMADALRMAG